MKQPVIQDLLTRSGIVNAEGMARALEVQARDGGSLGRILADLGLCQEEAAAQAIASGLGLPHVALDEIVPPAEADLCLPGAFCQQRTVLPLGLKDRAVKLASGVLAYGKTQEAAPEPRAVRLAAAIEAAAEEARLAERGIALSVAVAVGDQVIAECQRRTEHAEQPAPQPAVLDHGLTEFVPFPSHRIGKPDHRAQRVVGVGSARQ